MYATNNSLFIHIPKTGGGYVWRIMDILYNAEIIGIRHNTILNRVDRYIFATIRNPFDWYASVWAFGCEPQDTGFEKAVFPKKYKRLYDDPMNINNFREWLELVLNGPLVLDMYEPHPTYVAGKEGLLTCWYKHLLYDMTDNFIPHMVCRLENIDNELIAALKKSGDLRDGDEKIIKDYPKGIPFDETKIVKKKHKGFEKEKYYFNSVKRPRTKELYNNVLIDLVEQKEKTILNTYYQGFGSMLDTTGYKTW